MFSDEQIKLLEDRCNAEGIHYYDVRMEMIDHLAQSIEHKMNENPAVDFSKALNEMAASLGINGFHKVAEEKEKQVLRSTKKRIYTLLLAYFVSPKIIFSLALMLVLCTPWLFFHVSNKANIRFDVAVALLILSSIILYDYKKFKNPSLDLLSLLGKNSIKWWWGFVMVINCINLFNGFIDNWTTSNWVMGFFAFFTAIAILFALAWLKVYKQLYTSAYKKYPLAFSK